MSIQSNLFLTYIHETFQNLKACCFGVCWFWFCFFYPLGVYVSSHLLVLLIYQFSTDKRKPVAFSALEEIVALESALRAVVMKTFVLYPLLILLEGIMIVPIFQFPRLCGRTRIHSWL